MPCRLAPLSGTLSFLPAACPHQRYHRTARPRTVGSECSTVVSEVCYHCCVSCVAPRVLADAKKSHEAKVEVLVGCCIAIFAVVRTHTWLHALGSCVSQEKRLEAAVASSEGSQQEFSGKLSEANVRTGFVSIRLLVMKSVHPYRRNLLRHCRLLVRSRPSCPPCRCFEAYAAVEYVSIITCSPCRRM